MKHLSNCSPLDFIPAAIKLRAPLSKWLTAVGASEIYRRTAGALPEGAGADDVRTANARMLKEIIAAALECPALTREVLCIVTFTDPKDFESRPMRDYLEAAIEIAGDEAVRDFFTLLAAPETTPFSAD